MAKETLMFMSAKRTPFGAYGGALKDVHPTDLSVSASKAALEQAKVDPKEVDHVIVGNVLPSGEGSIYIPRHTGLKLGIPQEKPALGINRLCGTGFQLVVEAHHQILAGDTRIALLSGVENMSITPYLLRGARWGYRMGNTEAVDLMMESLYDTYCQAPMGITAENLAVKYGISRKEADEFALRSQTLTAQAQKEGYFREELAPFELLDKKGNKTLVANDEHPRPKTTIETLTGLKPVFKKDGVVTAGNASGIVDGAAALVVASEAETRRRNFQPLGRLVSYGICGCDPSIMGIGPAPAARQALEKAGMNWNQIDLIEVNEAFAPQTLAVEKELKLDRTKLNVNGGAIAVGHPLAASGTRIIGQLLYELRRRKKRFGLGSACIGGGQGIALVVEAFS